MRPTRRQSTLLSSSSSSFSSLLSVSISLMVILQSVQLVQTCTCQLAHPQQQFCDSDFVILARVKKENVANGTREYKIRIRKEYKMSEKSQVALKFGRLLTADESNMCGQRLEVGKVYAIGGKVTALQARINLCGLAEKWDDMTRRQRKGLKLMYRQGCTCTVKFCPPYRRCAKTKDACNWTSWQPDKKQDCQRNDGICLRTSRKQCAWSRNQQLFNCSRNVTDSYNYQPKNQTKNVRKKVDSPFRDDRDKTFAR